MINYLKRIHNIPPEPQLVDIVDWVENYDTWKQNYKNNYYFLYFIEEVLPDILPKIKSRLDTLVWDFRYRHIRKVGTVTLQHNVDTYISNNEFLHLYCYQTLADSIEIDCVDNNFWCKRQGEQGLQFLESYIKQTEEEIKDGVPYYEDPVDNANYISWLERQIVSLYILIDIYKTYKEKYEHNCINYSVAKKHAKEILDNLWALEHLE